MKEFLEYVKSKGVKEIDVDILCLLSDFFKETESKQLTLQVVGKSETKLICECEDGTYVWDNKKEDWTNCISCGLPDE